MRDDIGVVIAAAFEEVQKCPYYKKGRKACAAFKAGKLKSKRAINPVWGIISQKLRDDTLKTFTAQTLLKDTICLP